MDWKIFVGQPKREEGGSVVRCCGFWDVFLGKKSWICRFFMGLTMFFFFVVFFCVFVVHCLGVSLCVYVLRKLSAENYKPFSWAYETPSETFFGAKPPAL